MNEQEAYQKIVDECEGEQGFLIALHAYNQFDAARFHDLIFAFTVYLTAIEDRDVVDRRISGCAFFLLQTIERALGYEDKTSTRRREMSKAHAEIFDFILKLFQAPSK